MPLNPSVPLLLLLSNLQTFGEARVPGSHSVIAGPATVCSSLTQPRPGSMPGHRTWQGIHTPAPAHSHKYSPHTTVLQVHQLASNNDLIPPGVSWRARRSRTYCKHARVSAQAYTVGYLSTFPAPAACIALGQLKYEPVKERTMTTAREREMAYYSSATEYNIRQRHSYR